MRYLMHCITVCAGFIGGLFVDLHDQSYQINLTAPPGFLPLSRQRQTDVPTGKIVDMLGKNPRDQLRSAIRPTRPKVGNSTAQCAFKLSGQRGQKLLEKSAHFATHPFAGQILLPRERQDQAGARARAAQFEDARGLIQTDGPIAAHDPQQGFAMHAHLTGDLMPRLVGGFDSVGQDMREAGIRIAAGNNGLVHERLLEE
ncbi:MULTISPECIES: hypothetical protein [unclassified Croceicoccus]|uniref:hypothetical protein n=1 Tax=unclassified Croceicoccus TaxID=2629967 RepID=UPI001E5F454A|nr:MULTISPECIES: hypothetical protein [unclassified Croceicoccus]